MRLLFVLLLSVVGCADTEQSETRPGRSDVLRLAVTTSTRDSGLLDELIPTFERTHSARVDVIAVGTGAAIRLGENGDVDALLVHAREAEDLFLNQGHGVRREGVMYNTFAIVGPPDDPAGIRGLGPSQALQKIADTGCRFVSRGDDSGTHKHELSLRAGLPRGDNGNYIDCGQGMGRTLTMADEMSAYTLTDHGTYLRFRKRIELRPLVSGGDLMRNDYGALATDPGKSPRINARLADAFLDFLIDPETQIRIDRYRVDGERLFFPSRLPTDGD